MSANLTTVKDYFQTRFKVFQITSLGDQVSVNYLNSEGLLFVVTARERENELCFGVRTPLLLSNPISLKKFENHRSDLAESLSKGLSRRLALTVNQDGYVCTEINLGSSQISFPNEEVDTFIESSLILPFLYKKSSG